MILRSYIYSSFFIIQNDTATISNQLQEAVADSGGGPWVPSPPPLFWLATFNINRYILS